MSKNVLDKGQILVVDDEQVTLSFVSKVFEPAGYEALTAQSASEAIKLLENPHHKIRIAIIDLRLRGSDGSEIIRMMHEKQPDLPIVVMSAMSQRREECEKMGVDAFVEKPYSLEDLYECVDHVLKNRNIDSAKYQWDQSVVPCAKILLVDDESEACELLSESLFEDVPEAEYKIEWAKTGEAALELARTFQPDIAIIDVKMPGMSGIELIQRFKDGESYCPRDFVIYTGVTDPEIMSRAKDLGHKVITKPTDLETLFDVLQRICIRHHLFKKKS